MHRGLKEGGGPLKKVKGLILGVEEEEKKIFPQRKKPDEQ